MRTSFHGGRTDSQSYTVTDTDGLHCAVDAPITIVTVEQHC
jgi:hypothetical protein